MENLKLEYTEPDKTYKVIDAFNPPEEEEVTEPEYEYYLINVEKIVSADIAIKVLKTDNFSGLPRREQLSRIKHIIRGLSDFDFDEIETNVGDVREIDEAESNRWGAEEV